MKQIITIGENQYTGIQIKTETTNMLLIQHRNGFLGCGYFNIEAANKLGEHVAIVTGVKTFEDMLKAKVIKVSNAAHKSGIAINMTGEEVLTKIGNINSST